MKGISPYLLTLQAVILIAGIVSPWIAAAGQARLTGGALTIRDRALFVTLPQYPQSTLASRRQGLVVVEVTIAADGHVMSSNILQTFDEEASLSVKSAVNHWRFRDISKEGALKNISGVVMRGKLFFQFIIKNGNPTVIDLAAEAINSGHVTKAKMQ